MSLLHEATLESPSIVSEGDMERRFSRVLTFHVGDSPARECPSSRCTCYRSKRVPQIPKPVHAVHEVEWGRNTSAAECSHQMTRWARGYAKSESSRWLRLVRGERSESHVVPPASRRRSTRVFDFPKIHKFITWRQSRNPSAIRSGHGLSWRTPRCVIQIIVYLLHEDIALSRSCVQEDNHAPREVKLSNYSLNFKLIIRHASFLLILRWRAKFKSISKCLPNFVKILWKKGRFV